MKHSDIPYTLTHTHTYTRTVHTHTPTHTYRLYQSLHCITVNIKLLFILMIFFHWGTFYKVFLSAKNPNQKNISSFDFFINGSAMPVLKLFFLNSPSTSVFLGEIYCFKKYILVFFWYCLNTSISDHNVFFNLSFRVSSVSLGWLVDCSLSLCSLYKDLPSL